MEETGRETEGEALTTTMGGETVEAAGRLLAAPLRTRSLTRLLALRAQTAPAERNSQAHCPQQSYCISIVSKDGVTKVLLAALLAGRRRRGIFPSAFYTLLASSWRRNTL